MGQGGTIPSLPQRTVIAVVISLATFLLALIFIIAYCTLYRRKHFSNTEKGMNPRLEPWLSSDSPKYISRPLPGHIQENHSVNTFVDVDIGYASAESKTIEVSPLAETPTKAETYVQDDRSNARFPATDTVDKAISIREWASGISPPSFLAAALQADPHTLYTSSTSADRRSRWTLKRMTKQTLASSRSVSGRTILIQDDTKTREVSMYSDYDRKSVYPSTPSDPGQTSFSRHSAAFSI